MHGFVGQCPVEPAGALIEKLTRSNAAVVRAELKRGTAWTYSSNIVGRRRRRKSNADSQRELHAYSLGAVLVLDSNVRCLSAGAQGAPL